MSLDKLLEIQYKLLLNNYYSCVQYEHCEEIMGFSVYAGNQAQC